MTLGGKARRYEIRCTQRDEEFDTYMAPVRAYSDVVLTRSSVLSKSASSYT